MKYTKTMPNTQKTMPADIYLGVLWLTLSSSPKDYFMSDKLRISKIRNKDLFKSTEQKDKRTMVHKKVLKSALVI